jgi:type I restriction enzyme M protein
LCAQEIRQKLIEKDKVEAIIVLPHELFYTTDISVTLWILNENKKGGMWHGRKLRNREYEILFMDLRQWAVNPIKGEQKKKFELSAEQAKRASEIYFKWQSGGTDSHNYAEPELYRSVGFDELKENNFSLVPSRYIEFVDKDSDINYNAVLSDTANAVSDLLKRQKKNNETLRNALKQLGYECK